VDGTNIIYVFHSNSSFIQKDIDLLREKYPVRVDTYHWNRKYLIPFILIAQLFNLAMRSNAHTAYMIMFAGLWSVIPIWLAKLTGRRSFLIVGGTDCVSFPELNYGSLRKPLQRKAIGYSLRNCTTILPVSEQLRKSDYTYFDSIEKKQGYLSFFPDVNVPTKVIYNGYEMPPIEPIISKRPNSFITVARINNEMLFELKGIDLVLESARSNPDHSYTVVGISKEIVARFKLSSVRNLTCIPFSAKSDLDRLYREHQFYLCLSISEGFPNALCEGMSYGCIPIGSNVSSIPFIINDTGLILKKRDPLLLAELIKEVSSRSVDELREKSEAAKDRIATNFPLEKRRSAFFQTVGR
jgi:glycosyltransferase involved in cell wall biosynthesis